MPCPPVKDYYDYPDYVKKIIKEVEEGKVEKLKACLCKLRTPVDENYCIIKDEDQKVGVFPFCSVLVEDGVGDDTDYPLKLTLKEMMKLYWKTTNWKFSATHNSSCSCSYKADLIQNRRISQGDPELPVLPLKNLTCFHSFDYTADSKGETCCPNPTPPGGTTCYPISSSNTIVASLLGGPAHGGPIAKHKKEGNIYYFYPSFFLGFYIYAQGTATTQEGAIPPDEIILPSKDGGSQGVDVKILGKSTTKPLKLYTKIFADDPNPGSCIYSGSGYISNLEFT
jgi:hypothetical protein